MRRRKLAARIATTILGLGLAACAAAPPAAPETIVATVGLASLAAVGGLCAIALFARRRPEGAADGLRAARPNPAVVVETRAGIQLDDPGATLLRSVFATCQRVLIEDEFRSGDSGARAFLAMPVKPDGRADARAVVKIGASGDIAREFNNYRRFVKDTLPPVTARIQEPPLALAGNGPSRIAVLSYTFSGAGRQRPVSLREALLARPDPALLRQIFDTFGPNWWMQRHARAFTCAQEYDRALPVHLVVTAEAAPGGARVVDGRRPVPSGLVRDEFVVLSRFGQAEPRADGERWALTGAGQPPLRVRVTGAPAAPALIQPLAGRITDTRETLLRAAAGDGDLFGLPDPIDRLPNLLDRTVRGSQSIIHGDLNLDNALVGPPGQVWLIDFAKTRLGHPLSDFARLYADLVAHVVTPQIASPREALEAMASHRGPAWLTLLQTVDGMASRCLFDPADPSEWALARGMMCLGALRFSHLSPPQKRMLYLTAAMAWSDLPARM